MPAPLCPAIHTAAPARAGHARSFLRSLLLVLLLLAGFGCAAKEDTLPPIPGPATPCERLYVYAPGFLIVDLAAGSDILLNPGVREFRVFCSVEDAYNDLLTRVTRGDLPRGDWQIYALNGGYSELGKAVAPNRYVLARHGQIVEWCKHENLQR